MKRNQVILLSGMPASGKYTMAKRLYDTGGGALLDNHYFHDMFMNITEIPDELWGRYICMVRPLRQNFLDIIREFYPKKTPIRYIFTSVIVEGETFPDDMQQFANDIDADFIPIELHVSNEVLVSRCETSHRQMRKKLSNPNKLSRVLDDIAARPYRFSHPNTLVLNTTNMSEDETFLQIQNHLKQFD